jgi:branched-chain amino acid transport system ATP-binding protein
MSGDALLRVRGLTRSFGAVRASDGIDLDIAPGSLHAVIGPNGAGKSTLIGQLAGEIRPDAGSVHFAGRDITRLPVHRRARLGLARSFQITSIFPGFSVRENVALAVQAHAGHSFRFWRRADDEADLNETAEATLAELGLGARTDALAGELAHGERRQLELAMALAPSPRMLLLDEPMAGMSADEAARLSELLAGLRDRVTILLVEHDMDVVFALSDQITVLIFGRRVITGTPAEIRASDEVQAAYLGETG